jgi:hypothetical protein
LVVPVTSPLQWEKVYPGAGSASRRTYSSLKIVKIEG